MVIAGVFGTTVIILVLIILAFVIMGAARNRR